MLEMSYCHDKGIPHSEFLSWEGEDRAKTMAFSMEISERCTMCGTAGWEWEENRFAYTAVEELCQGCYQKSVFSDTQSKSLPGTNVKLVPTTPYLRAKLGVTAKKRAKKLKQTEADDGRRGHQPQRRTDGRQQPVRPVDASLGGGNVTAERWHRHDDSEAKPDHQGGG